MITGIFTNNSILLFLYIKYCPIPVIPDVLFVFISFSLFLKDAKATILITFVVLEWKKCLRTYIIIDKNI